MENHEMTEQPLDRIGRENADVRGRITQALEEVFFEVRRGETDIKVAGELNNTAGKIWKSHALDLAEAHFMNEKGIRHGLQLPAAMSPEEWNAQQPEDV